MDSALATAFHAVLLGHRAPTGERAPALQGVRAPGPSQELPCRTWINYGHLLEKLARCSQCSCQQASIGLMSHEIGGIPQQNLCLQCVKKPERQCNNVDTVVAAVVVVVVDEVDGVLMMAR